MSKNEKDQIIIKEEQYSLEKKEIALIDPLKEERKHWEELGYSVISRIQNPPAIINSGKCPVCEEFLITHYFITIEDRSYLILYGKDIPCLRLILPQRGDVKI